MNLIKSNGNWQADRDWFTKFSEEDHEHDRKALAEAKKKGVGVYPELRCDSAARGVVLSVRADSLSVLVTTIAEDWLTYDVLNCPAKPGADKSISWEDVQYSLSPGDFRVEASLDEKAADAEWEKVYADHAFGQ